MAKNIKTPSQTVSSVDSAPKLVLFKSKLTQVLTRCVQNNNARAFSIDERKYSFPCRTILCILFTHIKPCPCKKALHRKAVPIHLKICTLKDVETTEARETAPGFPSAPCRFSSAASGEGPADARARHLRLAVPELLRGLCRHFGLQAAYHLRTCRFLPAPATPLPPRRGFGS